MIYFDFFIRYKKSILKLALLKRIQDRIYLNLGSTPRTLIFKSL